MELLSFERKPAKMDTRFIFTIPSVYIRNGLVDPDKTYKVFLEEINEVE